MAAQQIGETKRVGGWRGSPNSLAALRRYKLDLQDNPNRCARCRQVAMKGKRLCVMHGSGPSRLLPDGHGRAERRWLNRLELVGLLPLELIALPVWRNLANLPTAQRSPTRLALVQAWDHRLTEPLRWAAVQRRATDLAKTPGKRLNTAAYYENI